LSCYTFNKGTTWGRIALESKCETKRDIWSRRIAFSTIAGFFFPFASDLKILMWKVSALYSILLSPYYIYKSDICAKNTLRPSHSRQFDMKILQQSNILSCTWHTSYTRPRNYITPLLIYCFVETLLKNYIFFIVFNEKLLKKRKELNLTYCQLEISIAISHFFRHDILKIVHCSHFESEMRNDVNFFAAHVEIN